MKHVRQQVSKVCEKSRDLGRRVSGKEQLNEPIGYKYYHLDLRRKECVLSRSQSLGLSAIFYCKTCELHFSSTYYHCID